MATVNPANAVFRQDGESIDYTPSTDVNAGDVVVMNSSLVGVAKTEIPADEQGSIALEGVYRVDAESSSSASAAYGIGVTLYFDATEDRVTTDSGDGVECGVALESAPDSDDRILVKLNA